MKRGNKEGRKTRREGGKEREIIAEGKYRVWRVQYVKM